MKKKIKFIYIFLVFGFKLIFPLNGFDLRGALIPANEILRGGPPRDGIPSIDNPQFIKAQQAYYLKNSDEVIGLVIRGEAKAYPINILNWHEIVNDQIGQTPFAVTYCPLCGSGLVFNTRVKKTILEFGVSGLLYNSDVLLYDRKTESLWSQLEMRAVTGKFKGIILKIIPSLRTSWGNWKKKNPTTLVLSRETGFVRDYTRSPYGNYNQNETIFFPVSKQSERYHPKEWVLAIHWGKYKKAYPFKELNKTKQSVIIDKIGNKKVKIIWDLKNQSGEIYEFSQGKKLPSFTLFWFAWYAFNGDGEVYQAK